MEGTTARAVYALPGSFIQSGGWSRMRVEEPETVPFRSDPRVVDIRITPL